MMLAINPAKKRLTRLDAIILAVLCGGSLFLLYRLFFILNYKWNWSVIATYLVRFDSATHRWTTNILLDGLLTTIKLSVWSTILATIFGSFIGFWRVSPRRFSRLFSRVYVELVRNIPPLVLIFICYYFLSDQVLVFFGLEEFFRTASGTLQILLTLFFSEPSLINQFISGIFTLALFQGAYIAEIVRAGIEAIDTGQWEAGQALGLSRRQQLQFVVLPQAIRIILPPLAGEFINTIKWSSVVSIISIQELTFQGMQVMASTQAAIEVWLTISAMYLVLCLTLSLFVRYLERQYNSPYRQHEPRTGYALQ